MLSQKVHDCYKLAGCKNANVPYMSIHRSGTRGNSSKIQSNVADIQHFYASRAVEDSMYSKLTTALDSLKFSAAQNKSTMMQWLHSLDIDCDKIPVSSFVHMEHAQSVKIWQMLSERVDCDPKKLFISRLWYAKDLKNCDHGIVRCQCVACVHEKTRCCGVGGCTTIPSFNIPGSRKPLRCVKHRGDTMVDVVNAAKRCTTKGCSTIASFNYYGKKPAVKCSDHKIGEMINVNESRRCVEESCRVYPVFNFPGHSPGVRCDSHKIIGMVDVVNGKCAFEGEFEICTHQPSFNFKGQVARLCKKHKIEGMLDVRNAAKLCTSEGCMTRASYNYNGKKPAVKCSQHKLDNMINVNETRRCAQDGCSSRPSFGKEGVATHCYKHKTGVMKSLRKRFAQK